MREITQETLYFVFRDTDGMLGFSLKEYDGEPQNPRFLFDGKSQAFLIRHPGQIISLDALAEECLPLLSKAEKVRFLETPEDSSNIVRQYDIMVTKIESIPQVFTEEEELLSKTA